MLQKFCYFGHLFTGPSEPQKKKSGKPSKLFWIHGLMHTAKIYQLNSNRFAKQRFENIFSSSPISVLSSCCSSIHLKWQPFYQKTIILVRRKVSEPRDWFNLWLDFIGDISTLYYLIYKNYERVGKIFEFSFRTFLSQLCSFIQ